MGAGATSAMMTPAFVIPTMILGAAVVDDLYTKKIHNVLVIAAGIVALVYAALSNGLVSGASGLAVAFLLAAPLVFTKMVGAGDLKIFMVFGMATDANAVFHVAVASLFWGMLLGFFRAVLKGQGLALLKNVAALLRRQSSPTPLHTMPFSVALFFGWLTHWFVLSRGIL